MQRRRKILRICPAADLRVTKTLIFIPPFRRVGLPSSCRRRVFSPSRRTRFFCIKGGSQRRLIPVHHFSLFMAPPGPTAVATHVTPQRRSNLLGLAADLDADFKSADSHIKHVGKIAENVLRSRPQLASFVQDVDLTDLLGKIKGRFDTAIDNKANPTPAYRSFLGFYDDVHRAIRRRQEARAEASRRLDAENERRRRAATAARDQQKREDDAKRERRKKDKEREPDNRKGKSRARSRSHSVSSMVSDHYDGDTTQDVVADTLGEEDIEMAVDGPDEATQSVVDEQSVVAAVGEDDGGTSHQYTQSLDERALSTADGPSRDDAARSSSVPPRKRPRADSGTLAFEHSSDELAAAKLASDGPAAQSIVAEVADVLSAGNFSDTEGSLRLQEAELRSRIAFTHAQLRYHLQHREYLVRDLNRVLKQQHDRTAVGSSTGQKALSE
ncbi:hypothetical protein HMN09_00367500 [Mycena chlorophos]|uniref:Uncharacterized protein n=1 Tax=Mycena chlorophos TaxID=658473 RepID=A0A8H6WI72_MYCCL|nr:hypothetical protein HMN09_00367500 [Mycena chlorophos]